MSDNKLFTPILCLIYIYSYSLHLLIIVNYSMNKELYWSLLFFTRSVRG